VAKLMAETAVLLMQWVKRYLAYLLDHVTSALQTHMELFQVNNSVLPFNKR